VLTILGALGTIGYVIATPEVEERFTEFYIVGVEGAGVEGKPRDYPRELVVGDEGRVMVGIVNHEHETVTYQIEVRIDGVKNNEVDRIVLEHGEKWEEIVRFSLGTLGELIT